MFRPSRDSDLGRDVAVQHFLVYSVCMPMPSLTVLKHLTQIEKYMNTRLIESYFSFISSPNDATQSSGTILRYLWRSGLIFSC